MLEELTNLSVIASFWGPLSALLLTSTALMGSPGPATISVAAMAAAFGPRRAARYLSGIILGTTAVLLIVASGLTGAVHAIPGAQPVLIGAAALYILYLAFKIATAAPLAAHDPDAPAPSFLGGFFLAIAGPLVATRGQRQGAAVALSYLSRVYFRDLSDALPEPVDDGRAADRTGIRAAASSSPRRPERPG